MNRKIKFTSLAAAALATIALSNANLNEDVKAASTQDAKNVKETKSPIEQAQDDVKTAKSNVDQADAALKQAKSDAVAPDDAFNKQKDTSDALSKTAQDKGTALQKAKDKTNAAQKLVDEANKPGAIDAAKKAVDDQSDVVSDKDKDLKATEGQTGAADKAINDAKDNLGKKNADLSSKLNDQEKAAQAVADAEKDLKNTNFDKVKQDRDQANEAVNKDLTDIQQNETDIANNSKLASDTKKNLQTKQGEKDNAFNAKNTAKSDYDTKNQQSKNADVLVNNENNKISSLNQQLQKINQLLDEQNKNHIKVNDLQAYRQAYADYFNNCLTAQDKAYIDKAINDNHYVPSERAAKERIDVNNLTKEQVTELSLFASYLMNQLRTQFGLEPNNQVTEGAVDFAMQVADGYRKDKWSILEKDDHDCKRINELSRENGLEAYQTDDFQQYEDASTYGNLPDNIEVVGDPETAYVPKTMDDLKRYVFKSVNTMLFGSGTQYEFDHARGMLGTSYDQSEILAEPSEKVKSLKESLVSDSNNPEYDFSLYGKLNSANQALDLMIRQGVSSEEDINSQKQLIQSLKNKINQAKEELKKLDTELPHYVGVDFVNIPISDGDLTSETQVHFEVGMTPESLTENSKFNTQEIPSYEKQHSNLEKQISEENTQLAALQNQAQQAKSAAENAKNTFNQRNAEYENKANEFNQAQIAAQKAQASLDKANQEKDILAKRKTQDLAKQAQAQLNYNNFQEQNKKLMTNYNIADKNKQAADKAVADAKKAVSDATDALKAANNAKQQLLDTIERKQKDLANEQAKQTQLSNHLSDLQHASEYLVLAQKGQDTAQTEFNTANKAASEAAAKLAELKTKKDAADAKVQKAQKALDDAKAKLASAQAKLDALTYTGSSESDSQTEGKFISEPGTLEIVKEPTDKVVPVYNGVNGQITDKTYKLGDTIQTLGYEEVNGTKWYKVSENEWIKDDPENIVFNAKERTISKQTKENKVPKTKSVLLKLIHNSYVYNKHGKLVKRHGKRYMIKKGHHVSVLNKAKIVKINGKRYYQIGKNEYVKAGNVITPSAKIDEYGKIKGHKNQKVRTYSSAGKVTKHHINGQKKYHFTAKKTIKGTKYYKLAGKNLWVRSNKISF